MKRKKNVSELIIKNLEEPQSGIQVLRKKIVMTCSSFFGEAEKYWDLVDLEVYICRVKVALTATAELSCSFAVRDFALVITGLRGAHVAFSTTIHPAFNIHTLSLFLTSPLVL